MFLNPVFSHEKILMFLCYFFNAWELLNILLSHISHICNYIVKSEGAKTIRITITLRSLEMLDISKNFDEGQGSHTKNIYSENPHLLQLSKMHT